MTCKPCKRFSKEGDSRHLMETSNWNFSVILPTSLAGKLTIKIELKYSTALTNDDFDVSFNSSDVKFNIKSKTASLISMEYFSINSSFNNLLI